MQNQNRMLRIIYFFLFLLSFGMVSCSDDEPIEVVVTNPVNTADNSIENGFRIDDIEIILLGPAWQNENFFKVSIFNENNTRSFEFGKNPSDLKVSPDKNLTFGILDRSEWRIYISSFTIGNTGTFSTTINPDEFNTTASSFEIPVIENFSSTRYFSLKITGKVVEL